MLIELKTIFKGIFMLKKAIQEYYPDEFNHCYGCGQLNEHGFKLKSYFDGDETVTVFIPKPYHISVPGFVYGGLIASIIDCHGIGTAVAAAYKFEGREIGTEPKLRYVTASLHVDYLRPTPLGVPLEVRGKVKELRGRKIVVDVKLIANGEICAKGEVVGSPLPQNMISKNPPPK